MRIREMLSKLVTHVRPAAGKVATVADKGLGYAFGGTEIALGTAVKYPAKLAARGAAYLAVAAQDMQRSGKTRIAAGLGLFGGIKYWWHLRHERAAAVVAKKTRVVRRSRVAKPVEA